MSDPISLRSRPYADHELSPGYRVAEPALRRRPRPALHVLLFAATFVSATLAYAISFGGVDPFANPAGVAVGVPYAFALLSILLAHELGHYVLARVHGVDVTLPFFIPAPPLFMIGTLGAFIRMRSMPRDRRALFDVGAAGPWAGIAVTVPLLAIGLALSDVKPAAPSPEGGFYLGEPLLLRALMWLVLGVSSNDVTVMLHPIAMAGWVGLLVTALNLMPVGQLDGGHVIYAALGPRWHRWIALGTMTTLIVLVAGGATSWLVWALLLLVLGLRHPRIADDQMPLDPARRWGAAASMVLFVLTFMPEPLRFVPPPIPRSPDAIPVSAPAPPPRSLPL
ncbi:site-2 protease family protein [bacterium]|nr:site-2 protease family protein [bacterium]